jgi:cytochrome c-type biogenesis protein CcmH
MMVCSSPRCVLGMFLAILALMAGGPALAVQPDEILPDPALEARARDISAELRCLVCQNQSIDDSNAPLARDLRLLVRERLKAGDSNAQVRAFLVARYGEFVLLRPPLSAATIVLWAAPLLLLLGGIWLLRRSIFARAASPTAGSELSPDERAALDRLLADREPFKNKL